MGKEITIRKLVELIADEAGLHDKLVFDGSKPEGTPCKPMDVSRAHVLGWQARTGFREEVAKTYSIICKTSSMPPASRSGMEFDCEKKMAFYKEREVFSFELFDLDGFIVNGSGAERRNALLLLRWNQ